MQKMIMNPKSAAPEIEWIREKIKAFDYNISEQIIRNFLGEKIALKDR